MKIPIPIDCPPRAKAVSRILIYGGSALITLSLLILLYQII